MGFFLYIKYRWIWNLVWINGERNRGVYVYDIDWLVEVFWDGIFITTVVREFVGVWVGVCVCVFCGIVGL